MAGKANYKIRVQDEATRRLRSIDSQMKGMSKSFMDFGKMLAVGGAVYGGVRALTGVISEAIDKFAIQEQAVAKLDAVIRATGGAAGFTSFELQKMASEMQKMTVYGDEAVIGAQSLMLTFRQISGDVFPRAMNAVADMSSLFGSLDSSAVQLGKALNDPTAGISALARVGITFSDEQKEMIRAFQDVNDLASAQDVILDELEMQFGGVAQAMADTRTGEMQQFQNAWGDMMEVIGSMTANAMSGVVDEITQAVTNITAALKGSELESQLRGLSRTIVDKGSQDYFKAFHSGTYDTAFNWQDMSDDMFARFFDSFGGGGGTNMFRPSRSGMAEFEEAALAKGLDIRNLDELNGIIDTLDDSIQSLLVDGINMWERGMYEEQTSLYLAFANYKQALDAELGLQAAANAYKATQEEQSSSGSQAPSFYLEDGFRLAPLPEPVSPSFKDQSGGKGRKGIRDANKDQYYADIFAYSFGDFAGDLDAASASLEQQYQEQLAADKEKAISEFQSSIREAQSVFSQWTDLGGGFFSALMDLEEQRHKQAIANLQKELEEFDKTYSSQLQLKRELGEDTEEFEARSAEKREEIEKALQEKKEEAMLKEFHAQQIMGLSDVGRKTAMGIMDVWAEHAGNPATAIPMSAFVTGIGATQAATILSQEVPQMAEGGLVLPHPGGRLINVAEKGRPEWIIPLDKAGMGGGINLYLTVHGPVVGEGGIDELSFKIARSMERQQRTGRLR